MYGNIIDKREGSFTTDKRPSFVCLTISTFSVKINLTGTEQVLNKFFMCWLVREQ